MKKTLKIKVKDETTVTDDLAVFKPWYNGVKKFYSIKILPPERKRDR